MENRLAITLYVICGIALVIIIILLCTAEGSKSNPFTREGFFGMGLGIMLCIVIIMLSYAGVDPPSVRQRTWKKEEEN